MRERIADRRVTVHLDHATLTAVLMISGLPRAALPTAVRRVVASTVAGLIGEAAERRLGHQRRLAMATGETLANTLPRADAARLVDLALPQRSLGGSAVPSRPAGR
jgi:hypothetical protein